MKRLVVIAVSLMLCAKCEAQIILNCSDVKPDTSICAKILAKAFRVKKEEMRYKNAPVEICSLGGAFVIAFGNSDKYNKAGFQLNCDEILPSKPFNNTMNGLKHGLWFECDILGRVKKVTQYNLGHVRSTLTFWTNGLPQRIVKYKGNGDEVIGGNVFYKRI